MVQEPIVLVLRMLKGSDSSEEARTTQEGGNKTVGGLDNQL
jgi:hypothetical protein